MRTALTKPTTLSLEDALDRPNRQAVRRSPAFETLALNVEAEQTIEEVKRLMDPTACHKVRSALRSTNIELTEPGERELAELSALIGKLLERIGTNMVQGTKSAYVAGVLEDLSTFPYLLVKPALLDARYHVEFPGKLVVWVYAQIENRLAGLKREQSIYQRMLAIADDCG
jgi:hypothetical protein